VAQVTYVPNLQGQANLFFAPDGDVQEYLGQLARQTAALAVRLAPEGKTGDLKRSISFRPIGNGQWEVVANTRYALFVHEGTRPHLIPKTPKTNADRPAWLRWVDQETGEVRFARQVNHPGTRPQPFLLGALGFVVVNN